MCRDTHTSMWNNNMPTMMMNSFNVVVGTFLITFLIRWAWRMVNWVWLKPKMIEKCLREQGLNGTRYKVLYGDGKEMAAMVKEAKASPISFSDDIVPRVHPFHHHIVNKYGKCSFFWVGPSARVMIMEPEMIKEILTNNRIFKKPTPNPLAKFLVAGLAGYEDEKWAKHRKIINPAFYIDKLKYMLPAMISSCNEIMQKWELLVSETSQLELNVQPYLEDLTADMISRTAFGSNYLEGREIFELQKEQAELTRQVLQSVYIPGSRFFPTKRNRRMKEINNELRTTIMGIIKKKEKTMKFGESNDDDLLSTLMKSNQKEIQQHGNNHGMSVDEVIEECKIFYFAGQESSSNLLAWAMLMLAMHPTWQTQAREEVWQIFGNGAPDFDGLNRLKIVTMILHEVLRLYPPATIFTRTIYEETKLAELTLPAGVMLMLPILFVQRDQELWGEDAKEFKPERFSEGTAKATKNRLSFFPFSCGPRICIGNNFAMMEAKVALAMVLQRFSFELSPSYTHAPTYVVTLQPQNGVHIVLNKI